MPDIERLSGIRFKNTRLLLTKKHRLQEGKCLIEGRRFVSEALAAGAAVESVLVTGEFASEKEGGDLVGLARRAGAAVLTITPAQLAALSDTVTAQGVVAVAGLPGVAFDALPVPGRGRSLIVGLEAVADPGNVGTIIRTSAWFGADAVVMGEGTAELSNPKLLRATMGAVFRIPVVPGVDLLEAAPRLKRRGYRIVVSEAGGADADAAFAGGGRVFLIFGSEAHGIRRELSSLADARYGIPRYGTGESLNVSVAVGVALSRYRSITV
jgi:TrmH family RNA methyltransferase